MITLNEQQIKDLEIYLGELPAKYANPIFKFLETIKQEQKPKQETNQEK